MNSTESLLNRMSENALWGGNFLSDEQKTYVAYHEPNNHSTGQLGGGTEILVNCANSFLDKNMAMFECGIVGRQYDAD